MAKLKSTFSHDGLGLPQLHTEIRAEQKGLPSMKSILRKDRNKNVESTSALPNSTLMPFRFGKADWSKSLKLDNHVNKIQTTSLTSETQQTL